MSFIVIYIYMKPDFTKHIIVVCIKRKIKSTVNYNIEIDRLGTHSDKQIICWIDLSSLHFITRVSFSLQKVYLLSHAAV